MILVIGAVAAADPSPDQLSAQSTSAAQVAQASVVNIATAAVVRQVVYEPFWGFAYEGGEQRQEGVGSGVVMTASGLVLTNAHVLENASEIRVELADGTSLMADVVGTDVPTDLAIIQLKGKLPKLTPIALGNSDALQIGEVVLAIGNPFGIGQTVSMGIVSATGRAPGGLAQYADYIQTDAAVNPGNSGGALVNLRGELVGINSAIVSKSGGFQGIAFAIPVNMARPIIDELVKHGKVNRGYHGATFLQNTPQFAQSEGFSLTTGAVIAKLMRGSPAHRAGLLPGDIVLAADGKAFREAHKLANYLSMLGAGTNVTLEYMRGTKRQTVTFALGQPPKRRSR